MLGEISNLRDICILHLRLALSLCYVHQGNFRTVRDLWSWSTDLFGIFFNVNSIFENLYPASFSYCL